MPHMPAAMQITNSRRGASKTPISPIGSCIEPVAYACAPKKFQSIWKMQDAALHPYVGSCANNREDLATFACTAPNTLKDQASGRNLQESQSWDQLFRAAQGASRLKSQPLTKPRQLEAPLPQKISRMMFQSPALARPLWNT